MLVVPLLVAPTELTDNTEAYGLKLLQITVRLQPIYWERGRLIPNIHWERGRLVPNIHWESRRLVPNIYWERGRLVPKISFFESTE